MTDGAPEEGDSPSPYRRKRRRGKRGGKKHRARAEARAATPVNVVKQTPNAALALRQRLKLYQRSQ